MLREILSPINRSTSTFLKTLGRCANVRTISLGKAVNDSLDSFLLPRVPRLVTLVLLALKLILSKVIYGLIS